MIGRTIDAMLSPLQIAGRECRRAGEDSIFLYLVDTMRNLVLPVEKCKYWTCKGEGEDEEKTKLLDDNWSIYFPNDWELKRECAKAFEKRRSVKVGGSFSLNGTARTGFGTFNRRFNVTRIRDNAVVYRGHLISSQEKTLIELKAKGLVPVLYQRVLY